VKSWSGQPVLLDSSIQEGMTFEQFRKVWYLNTCKWILTKHWFSTIGCAETNIVIFLAHIIYQANLKFLFP
jgi:hypothetical protein